MKQKCMDVSQVLFQAITLLTEPRSWRIDKGDKSATAWDAVAACDPLSLTAEAWSVEGACIRVSREPEVFERVKPHLLAFSPRLGSGKETITHEQVLSLLRGAWMHSEMTERLKR